MMTSNDASANKEKERFSFCPQCGRKGMYHIKLQYHRCRYCGTYVIAPEKKKESELKPEPEPEFSALPATG
jgi:hypothetical protein